MTAKTFKLTSFVCPLQAEGHLIDGRMYYFRYRHDVWRVDVSKEPVEEWDFCERETLAQESRVDTELVACLRKAGLIIPPDLEKEILKTLEDI